VEKAARLDILLMATPDCALTKSQSMYREETLTTDMIIEISVHVMEEKTVPPI